MKRLVGSVLTALFFAVVAVPVFAADSPKEATPTAKTVKHKAAKPHKKSSHKKGGMKPEATPAVKK